jgi:hypothetical protein
MFMPFHHNARQNNKRVADGKFFFLINVSEFKHFGKFDQLFGLIHFFCLCTESKSLEIKMGDIILVV